MSPDEKKRQALAAWFEDQIGEEAGDLLFADGFEDACIGIVRTFNTVAIAYDYEKCVEILVRRDGMTEMDAEEFMEFNVTGAYVGEHTPAFLVAKVPRTLLP